MGDESRPLEVGSLGNRKTQKDTTALGKVVSTMYTSFPHGTEVPFVIRGLNKIISLELKIVMESLHWRLTSSQSSVDAIEHMNCKQLNC